MVNGVGNLVSAFMPTLMGVAIAASGGHGFGAGFALLAGAQAITLVCGAWLLARPVQALSDASAQSTTDRSDLAKSQAS